MTVSPESLGVVLLATFGIGVGLGVMLRRLTSGGIAEQQFVRGYLAGQRAAMEDMEEKDNAGGES